MTQWKAVEDIPTGHPIVIGFYTTSIKFASLQEKLIVQFDGSCLMAGTERAASGAGVVVWKATEDGLFLLDWATCTDKDVAAGLRGMVGSIVDFEAAAEGVLIEPGDVFFAPEAPPLNYFRLAYSSIPEARIDEGVSRLASAIETLRCSVG